MKKVFQSRVCDTQGDCCRAVIASLFDKELEGVPEFKPDHSQGYELMKFFQTQGYDYSYFNRRADDYTLQSGKSCPTIEEVAKYDGGVGGYFYASVKSQTFENTSHAVVVDTNLNIVHDPNPNGLALNLGPKDVQGIITVGSWHINLEGEFVKDEN
jgi:hypothetical protein